jgi:hypothetical protein
MISLRASQTAHRRALSARRPSRPRHFAPTCDFLETRQLLSVSGFSAGTAMGAIPAALVAQPSVSVMTSADSATPAGLSSAQAETASGVNQVTFGRTITIGFGQTIAIIKVNYNPNIASDLARFALQFGLFLASSQDLNPISTPSSTTTGSGSNASTGSTSSSNSSVTPLTPVILATFSFNGRSLIVVIVEPQPLVANLGPSNTPVTTQAILATVASEEAAVPMTHFGQGSGDEATGLDLGQPIKVEPQAPSGIDFIEPFQPDAPREAPEEGAAPKPNDARPHPQQVIPDAGFGAALDLDDWDLLPGSPMKVSSSSEDRPDESQPSLVPSTTMFGVAAVAMSGYQLAMRQSDRFGGRWVPGRSRTKRSASRSTLVSNR